MQFFFTLGRYLCVLAFPCSLKLLGKFILIPDRAKAQVFEMFYTGQSRIADSHRSLGLGLPLCRAILTAHGGTLTLRDNIPNGSVFSLALPQSEVNIHE